jgi:hypothetical protein
VGQHFVLPREIIPECEKAEGRGSPAKAELHKASCGGNSEIAKAPIDLQFSDLTGQGSGAVSQFPDARLLEAAVRLKYTGGKLVKGNIGSACQHNRIKWLRATYGIDSEDMESASSVGAAVGRRVPFSDHSDRLRQRVDASPLRALGRRNLREVCDRVDAPLAWRRESSVPLKVRDDLLPSGAGSTQLGRKSATATRSE